jgi:hypothetical protein
MSNNDFIKSWQSMQLNIPCITLIEDIDNVFDIIYSRNFQNYLCEILDGKHTYHIFNTYIFIEYAGYFSGNFTFFSLLALKPDEKLSGVFNDIYTNKLMNKQKDANFMKDMQYVIDIFLNIYQFPSHPIIEPTEESKNTHTNQEIIDLIVRTDIIRKETYNAISEYDFITGNRTTGSIIKKLPFVHLLLLPFNIKLPVTILIVNEKMKTLYDMIVKYKPPRLSNSKTRSSRQSSSSRQLSSAKPSPIKGIAEYIPGLSPSPSPRPIPRSKRSTLRNTSLFDNTRKKYTKNPKNPKNPKNTNTKRRKIYRRRKGVYGLF